MYKKTLLSIAIASTLTLTGCLENDKNEDENIGADANGLTQEQKDDLVAAAGTYPIFNPAISAIPIPNDLIFDSVAGDGSFKIGEPTPPNPVFTAINSLSGASTVAPIDLAMNGLITENSVFTNALNSNIFLVALEYASGSPVQGLPIGEPPTASDIQPSFTHKVITLDGTHFLRILPTKPLAPNTRYVVIVTDEIRDAAGDQIKQSPSYAHITDENETLLADSLQGVRSLMNGLWESVGLLTFNTPNPAFGGVSLNTARQANSLPALTEANIAMSYSFTTSDDEKILSYVAEPATWITDQLSSFVKVSATKAALAGGATSYQQVEATVNGAYDAWLPSSVHAALAGCDAAPVGDARFTCAGSGLFGALEAGSLGITANFPDPEPTAITFGGPVLDVNAFNPAIPATLVSATQGEITVPYYSGLPTNPDIGPAALKFTQWEADEELATNLNMVFAANGLPLVLPQGRSTDENNETVAAKSKVVNAIFPFPKKQGDVTIPVLAMYPSNPTGDMKTMIWGHGLSGNRTQAVGFGPALITGAMGAGQNVAVLAIDEPLHGIDDATSPLLTTIERHFNYVAAPGQMPSSVPNDSLFSGVSGSMFINIEHFMATRGNNLQNALDLFTLRKSIDNIDFATANDPDSTLGVFYSGHSLGTISSQAFVATANSTTTDDDNITASMFFTPGGGITRFFDNSPAFAPNIIDGLAFQGVTVDTSSYQAYLNILQAALDPFDAVNFTDNLVANNSKVLYMMAVNDKVIPVSQASDDRTYNDVTGNGVTIAGSVSHLSGAEPLAQLTNAIDLQAAGNGNTNLGIAVSRYTACDANHGTPSSASPLSGFSENVAQATSIVTSNGAFVTVADDTVLQALPLPAWSKTTACSP